MRVFIFGIGGTGARVLRSLAMLLASGIKFEDPSLEIVPIVIDMDAHNGDTARTREVFRNYYAARRAFVDPNANAQSETFFNTRIRSFNHLDAEAGDMDLQFDFQNADKSFADHIHFAGLKKSNKDVLELFYNDSGHSSDFPELYLKLSVGFKGNPNIGSVVFNQLKESQQFKDLAGSYTENDRVFIVSSIFGGTGSSGFPTLVKLIRTSSNPVFANTKLGAITVMPYFNVAANDNSAINSTLFNTKTKSALSYYADDTDLKSINALYYLADSNQPGTLPNVEGGEYQINNGHVIELIAATAIVDFIFKPDNKLQLNSKEETRDGKRFTWKEGKCYEFGAESDANPFTIAQFNTDTKERCIKPLVKFAYAAQIATQLIPKLKDNAFYGPNELNIANSLGIPNEYNKLLTFFNEFKKWTGVEMSSPGNGRSFNSFYYGDPEHLNNLIHGKPISTRIFYSGLSMKTVAEWLNEVVKEPKDTPTPRKYLSMLYKTATKCLKELGQLP